MFSLDKIDMQRIAVSVFGALLLSTLFVAGSVGPAMAADSETPAATDSCAPVRVAAPIAA